MNKNKEKLFTEFKRIQNQYPNLAIMEALTCFQDQITDHMDINIHSVNNTYIEDHCCIWQIICSGPSSDDLANAFAMDEPSASVFIHDLMGTINGEELYSITYIIG